MASNTLILTEDEIDDLLYLARVNDLPDLQQLLKELSSKYTASKIQILDGATDPETGNSPLHYASANGHIEVVKILLDIQTTPDSSDVEDKPIEPNSVVNSQNKSGNTPLHWAALNGHLQIITLLLKQGADPSILNVAGHDALFEAELNERQEAVEVLLAEGKGLDQGLAGDKRTEGAEDVDEDTISESDDTGNRQNVQGIVDEMHKMEVEETGGTAKG